MFLPCPFCGEDPHYSVYQSESLWSHNIVDWHEIQCYGCDISMHQCEDLDELEQRWNHRSNQQNAADGQPSDDEESSASRPAADFGR